MCFRWSAWRRPCCSSTPAAEPPGAGPADAARPGPCCPGVRVEAGRVPLHQPVQRGLLGAVAFVVERNGCSSIASNGGSCPAEGASSTASNTSRWCASGRPIPGPPGLTVGSGSRGGAAPTRPRARSRRRGRDAAAARRPSSLRAARVRAVRARPPSPRGGSRTRTARRSRPPSCAVARWRWRRSGAARRSGKGRREADEHRNSGSSGLPGRIVHAAARPRPGTTY